MKSRDRARKGVAKKSGWAALSAQQQKQQIDAAEAGIMAKRVASGLDCQSKMTATLNNEAEALAVIDKEEMTEKMNHLVSYVKLLQYEIYVLTFNIGHFERKGCNQGCWWKNSQNHHHSLHQEYEAFD